MRAKTLVVMLALAVLAVSVWPARQLGTEFMPNLNEGTLLYMPTTLPGISVTKAGELMQTQDRIIRSFPEVASVYGKAGRAATATDPAPSEMFETVVNLKPKEEWRPGVTVDGLIAEMDKALQFPGVSNAWTMPIKARIDMLSTGIRTPVGVKVIGTDLVEIDRLAKQIEQVLKAVPGTSSAYAERGIGGYYLEVTPDRDGARALRHHGPGRAGHHRDRARRPDGDDDGRGPAALHGQHALSARLARQSAGHRQRRAGADAGGRRRPARRGGQGRAGAGADVDPDRERAAGDLHLRRHPRPRSRRLRRRRAARRAGQHPVPARLLRDVERPVRISASAPPPG